MSYTGASITTVQAAPRSIESLEDSIVEGGDSIDTFAYYKPSALPDALITVLSDGKVAYQHISNDKREDATDDEDSSVVIIERSGVETSNLNRCTAFPDSVPSHASHACESALLSSVQAPKVSDEAATTLLDLAESRALSPLQLEGVCLAISRHNRLYQIRSTAQPSSSFSRSKVIRAGFFLGDGAGVGKGRQIAAILKDSLCRSRNTQRHLWISVSRELVVDAQRDLTDVGVHCTLHDGSALLDQYSSSSSATKGLGAGLGLGKGILFLTYALLVSGQNSKRMEEIIQWLAMGVSVSSPASKKNDSWELEQNFDGCIIFDEAHKAKNLEADTTTAKLVIQLQRRLPKARVVYCSATGVSDVKHMVYAERLGLWGTDDGSSTGLRSIFQSFQHFQGTMKQRGLGSLEMLALEMKQMGSFVARTLSWDGAEFETVEIPLSPDQIRVYDDAVQWWIDLKVEIEQILQFLSKMGSSPNKMIWRNFWSAHQRFFKELAICAKVPYVAQNAKEMLQKGHSVVVGLQGTGEAGTQSALDELRATLTQNSNFSSVDVESIELPNLLSTTGATMINFVRNHFPTAILPPKGDGRNGSSESKMQLQQVEESTVLPSTPLPELIQRRQKILERVAGLALPPNPLDDLIERLGGVTEVAEMTGRVGRIIRTQPEKKYFQYVRRGVQSKKNSYGLSSPVSEEADRVNLIEKNKFMDGEKHVAIISDAASTGISLHSARDCASSHRRRVHFTIELPWAADKAIQQLGRSHRSNQVTAPIYKLVVTKLGGERRFSAAVSKRMANMGALTKGDRRAATGSDLADFDIDNRFGNRALKRFYAALMADPPVKPSRGTDEIVDSFIINSGGGNISKESGMDFLSSRIAALLVAKQALDEIGLISASSDAKKGQEVKSFLNRICGLPVLRQNLVFELFMSTLNDVVTEAKSTGEFEAGVEDVKATTIEINGKPEVLAVDLSCGAQTRLTRLILDRGIPFTSVCEMAIAASNTANTISDKDSAISDKDVDASKHVAETGFYLSRNPISGRHLILFAKRKVDVESFKSLEDAVDYDPLGLMVITRPNTGTNPCEMTTRELNTKYKLILSAKKLKKLLDSYQTSSDPKRHEKIAALWDAAYKESDHFLHNNALAPRRQEIGIITGAVLHIMPALEKAVMARSGKERALRVLRVEITNTSQRMVGVRFPVDSDAIKTLTAILVDLKKARASEGAAFFDEPFAPVCQKSMAWATTERNTMKTFFSVVPSVKKINGLLERGSKTVIDKPVVKRGSTTSTASRKDLFLPLKKPKTITAFFKKNS